MNVKTDLGGKPRKTLALHLSKWLGFPVRYCGAPTFAYEIGEYTLTKDAVLVCPDGTEEDTMFRLSAYLYDNGFELDITDFATAAQGESYEDYIPPTHYEIEVPMDGMDEAAIDRLRLIIKGKADLIMKATMADNLTVLENHERGVLVFPWIQVWVHPKYVDATTTLIFRMVDMAINSTRASGKEREAENEKYAFRCFLLRLGFIGDEYKEARKVLLDGFAGSAAFKSGKKGVSA